MKILEALKNWSERTDVSPEEVDLAKKIYEDFSRLPPIEEDVSTNITVPDCR